MSNKKVIRILGVDPGSLTTGFGLIDVAGSNMSVVDCGEIKNKSQLELNKRFLHIYSGLEKVIKAHQPHCMAIEKLFYCKNVQSAFKLGEARGVALLAGAKFDLDIFEYEPRKIKLSVTGYGAASKDQVQSMIQSILNLKKKKMSADISDALAIAICHAHHLRFVQIQKTEVRGSSYAKATKDRQKTDNRK